jgi:hypothetical protein
MANMLNKSFSAKLQKSHKGGWTYVVWPNSVGYCSFHEVSPWDE